MGGSHWGVIHNQSDKELVYILHYEKLTPTEAKVVTEVGAEIKAVMTGPEGGNIFFIQESMENILTRPSRWPRKLTVSTLFNLPDSPKSASKMWTSIASSSLPSRPTERFCKRMELSLRMSTSGSKLDLILVLKSWKRRRLRRSKSLRKGLLATLDSARSAKVMSRPHVRITKRRWDVRNARIISTLCGPAENSLKNISTANLATNSSSSKTNIKRSDLTWFDISINLNQIFIIIVNDILIVNFIKISL